MLNIEQKKNVVEQRSKSLKGYSTVAILPLGGIPDRLLQSIRNKMRGEAEFMTGRKNILTRILKSDSRTAELVKHVDGTCAVVMTNSDPFTLYKAFKGSSIKLAAKPNQIAPEDINIEAGETSIAPGQAVTELKTAGIDVRIDRGKVVISKSKVLVKKGEKISINIAKALHTLEIQPFSAELVPSVTFSGGLVFTPDILSISRETTVADILQAFSRGFALSIGAKIVNKSTIGVLMAEAYRNAVALGVGAKIYDTKIVERLLEIGRSDALKLEGSTKKE